MSANTAIAPKANGRIRLDSVGKYDAGGQIGLLIGSFTATASYDTNGSVLDLSSYFSAVPDIVIIEPAAGVVAQYVAGATAALGLVKMYNAVLSHTHTAGAITVTDGGHTHTGGSLVVTGGAAAAGTKALYLNGTTALNKEEATSTTLVIPTTASGTTGITAAGATSAATLGETSTETASTTNLATITFRFMAFGNIKF